MKSLTDLRKYVATVILATVAILGCNAQVESNPMQYVAIEEGTSAVNDELSKQTNGLLKTAQAQGMIAAEFEMMKKWEGKYNSYLKTAKGYAEAIKAGTTLYAEGVETLTHLFQIKKACAANPEGIAASLAWSDIYLDVTVQFIKTYSILKEAIASGGKNNMLTGAERTEMLWKLNDELSKLNTKLRKVAISIAFYNMTDVFNKITAGMIDKSYGQIAEDALKRWRKASKVSGILN